MQPWFLFLCFVGGAIILGLSIYAGILLAKLQQQNKQQLHLKNAAIKQRNDNIIESVDVIARATLQEQCDLSEAAIRLYMLMIHLQGDKAVAFETRFPALYELYDVVKDMPRGDDRSALTKKDRKPLDNIRISAEVRLHAAIHAELDDVLGVIGTSNTTGQPLAS